MHNHQFLLSFIMLGCLRALLESTNDDPEMLDLSGLVRRCPRTSGDPALELSPVLGLSPTSVSSWALGQRTQRSRKGQSQDRRCVHPSGLERARAGPSGPKRTRCKSPGAVSRQTNRAFRWTRQDLILIKCLPVVFKIQCLVAVRFIREQQCL